MTFDRFSSEQPVQGFVRGLGEGQPIELPGWSMRVKVTAADTLAAILTPSGYEEYFRKVAQHVATPGTCPTRSSPPNSWRSTPPSWPTR